jgi:hypothetical protein
MTVSGTLTNSGNVTVWGATSNLTVGHYVQTGAGAVTTIEGGTFIDPPTIDIEGGTFGGAGTVDGSVSLTNGSTLQVGDPGGQLYISGDYSQDSGQIVFDIAPNGIGGFSESTLEFDRGANISIDNTDIVFDFIDGADRATFLADGGSLDPDNFFQMSDSSSFLADYPNIFSSDSFTTEVSSGTPEPGTLGLLLPGLALLALAIRRRKTLSFE